MMAQSPEPSTDARIQACPLVVEILDAFLGWLDSRVKEGSKAPWSGMPIARQRLNWDQSYSIFEVR